MRRLDAIRLLEYAFTLKGIKYFKPEEFLPEGRLAPPLPLIMHIVPTVVILDQAREQLGPITVNSGYRDPAYNQSIGGVPNSQHIKFMAADVQPRACTIQELYDFLNGHPYSSRFGLGRYENFIHLDTRAWPGMGGTVARWDQRLSG